MDNKNELKITSKQSKILKLQHKRCTHKCRNRSTHSIANIYMIQSLNNSLLTDVLRVLEKRVSQYVSSLVNV